MFLAMGANVVAAAIVAGLLSLREMDDFSLTTTLGYLRDRGSINILQRGEWKPHLGVLQIKLLIENQRRTHRLFILWLLLLKEKKVWEWARAGRTS
jgi:hypothetical protein